MKHENFEHHRFPNDFFIHVLNVNGNKIHVKRVQKENRITRTRKTFTTFTTLDHYVFSLRELKNGDKKLNVYSLSKGRIENVTQTINPYTLEDHNKKTDNLLQEKLGLLLVGTDYPQQNPKEPFVDYYKRIVFRNPLLNPLLVNDVKNNSKLLSNSGRISAKFLGTESREELMPRFLRKEHQTSEVEQYIKQLPADRLALLLVFSNILSPAYIQPLLHQKEDHAPPSNTLRFLMSHSFVEAVKKMDADSAKETLRLALDARKQYLLVENSEWFSFMAKPSVRRVTVDEKKFEGLFKPNSILPNVSPLKGSKAFKLIEKSFEENNLLYLVPIVKKNVFSLFREINHGNNGLYERYVHFLGVPCLLDGLSDVVAQKKRKYVRFLKSQGIPVTEQNIEAIFRVDFDAFDRTRVLFTKKMWNDFISLMRQEVSISTLELYCQKNITLTDAKIHGDYPAEWLDVLSLPSRQVKKPINKKEMFTLRKR